MIQLELEIPLGRGLIEENGRLTTKYNTRKNMIYKSSGSNSG